jgi:hypothetical protein
MNVSRIILRSLVPKRGMLRRIPPKNNAGTTGFVREAPFSFNQRYGIETIDPE